MSPPPFPLMLLPPSTRHIIYVHILTASPRLIPLPSALFISREVYLYLIPRIYGEVELRTLEEVESFGGSEGARREGGRVKRLSIHLGGGSTLHGSSTSLAKVISLTKNLDEIELVLFTLRVDPFREALTSALQALNPKKFTWTSPDPAHNFTIATFSTHVAPIFASYTRLTHLTLSNVSFMPLLDPARGEPEEEVAAAGTFTLPEGVRRRLRRLEVRRAVFLDPRVVVGWLGDVGQNKRSEGEEEEEDEGKRCLKVVLEDVYLESIWGPRMRMKDLELAAAELKIDPVCLERVEIRGVCERIQGGDRMDSQDD